MSAQSGNIEPLLQVPFPHPERRHARASLVGPVFRSFHAGIEGGEFFPVDRAVPHGHAVVRHENHQGVLEHAMGLEVGEEEADIVVDIFDHAVARSGLFIESEIEKAAFGFLGREHGAMGGVQRNVGEEGLFGRVLLVDPRHGCGKEQVCAEAFRANDRVIVQQHAVEVGVLGVLFEVAPLELPDAAGSVHENLVEAALLGQIRLVVAKVPLAKQASGVTGAPQGLGNRDHLGSQALALVDGVGDAHFKFMPPAHQRGSRRRTGGADMEVGEARSNGVEAIEVGSLQIRVAHAG